MCDYWPVFAKEDSQSGYNDWEVVDIVPAPKGFDEDDALDSKEDSMDTIGWRISQGIVKGGFGGYAVEHDGYDYYIVQWDSEPKKAEKTEVIVIDGEEFLVTEGGWICYSRWLDKLPNTTKWWYQTDQRCVVRLQVVCDPSLALVAYHKITNPLHINAGPKTIQSAEENETWQVPEESHDFLIEEANSRAVFDFTYEGFNEGEGSDEEEGEPTHENDEDSEDKDENEE